MTVKEFLIKHNQSTDNVDANVMVQVFIDEMKLGLCGSGSIPMIPTYLTNIDRSKIKAGKRILIDAGGTNFRSAVGYFDENGKVVVDNVRKTVMPASDKYLTKQEFYQQIAQNISYLADECTDVGFCFSYPVDMNKDVDGTVQKFSKEVKAPEVIGTCVGKETLLALQQYSDKQRKIVILNDTVATLLGGMAVTDKIFSAYIGYIFGTGTNLCYIEDTKNITKVDGLAEGKMLINTESGSFDKFAQGTFDKIVANSTAKPQEQLFEKMTSGKYLADVIYHSICNAANEGLFSCAVTPCNVVLKDISAFVVDEPSCLDGFFGCDKDIQLAKEICLDLIDRAAKMGAIMNSAAAILSCTDKSLPVAIVAEGTTFNKLPTYKQRFSHYLEEILGQRGITFQIIQGEELNLVGTLMATMVL